MQEQEAVKILGVFIKISSMQKRALQFHDIVLAESKKDRLAKAAKQVKSGTASSVPRDGQYEVGTDQRPPPKLTRETKDLKPNSGNPSSNKPRLKV